jgi:hypothetical protein
MMKRAGAGGRLAVGANEIRYRRTLDPLAEHQKGCASWLIPR